MIGTVAILFLASYVAARPSEDINSHYYYVIPNADYAYGYRALEPLAPGYLPSKTEVTVTEEKTPAEPVLHLSEVMPISMVVPEDIKTSELIKEPAVAVIVPAPVAEVAPEEPKKEEVVEEVTEEKEEVTEEKEEVTEEKEEETATEKNEETEYVPIYNIVAKPLSSYLPTSVNLPSWFNWWPFRYAPYTYYK